MGSFSQRVTINLDVRKSVDVHMRYTHLGVQSAITTHWGVQLIYVLLMQAKHLIKYEPSRSIYKANA